MSKHDDCCYGDYFAEYSMRLCNHPKNKEHHCNANCRGCKLFESWRQRRISELKAEIKVQTDELRRLEEKEAKANWSRSGRQNSK